MEGPTSGNTLDEIVEYYFPKLPPGPREHARDYLARLICLYSWRIGARLDELPPKAHRLGEGAELLELRESTERLAVAALQKAYSCAVENDSPDWTKFERIADSLPRYGTDKDRGLDSSSWPAKLPVLPWLLFGKNAKPFPRSLEC